MTLRQLELFVAVAETGSFSRGAEIALLTQSTVSQHIAALEEELDARLLDRTSKGIFLTTAGQLLLQHARRVLGECTILKQEMAGLHGLNRAHLSLGASNIPANHLLPRFLPLLKQKHPGITMEIRIGDTDEMLAELHSGTIELAIVGGRTEDPAVIFEPFITDHLVLIVGTGHPLRHQGTIRLDALFDIPMVVREEGSGTYQALQKALHAAGHDTSALKIVARLGSDEAVRQTVAAGFGCAFVSDLSIGAHLRHGELHRVEIADFAIERQLWLGRLRERTPSPAALAVANLLRETFSNAATTTAIKPVDKCDPIS